MNPEQEYQLLIQQTYQLTERRQEVTTIYLSVNAAIIGATAFLFKDGELMGWTQEIPVFILLIAGIVACDVWRRLVQQYTKLIKWWYEQVRAIENKLTPTTKPFTHEYAQFYQQKQGEKNVGLTRYEILLTWLFTVLYLLFSLAIFLSILARY